MSNEWVHCNYCGQLADKDIRFRLSNCGHISCHKCMRTSAKPHCCLCHQDVKFVEINSKMDADLKLYFCEIAKTQKKFFDEIRKIETFQTRNRQRLLAHRTKMLEKSFNTTKNYSRKIADNAKTIADMSMQIAQLEKEKHDTTPQFRALMHEGTFISDES